MSDNPLNAPYDDRQQQDRQQLQRSNQQGGQNVPQDAKQLREERAKEFFEQWKGGAQNASREYIIRQTPMEIQGEMEKLVGEEFGVKLPLDDVQHKLWQIDAKGVHPTELAPGTPLFVQRQIAAQISEYEGMTKEIESAEAMLANPEDAGAVQPPPSGSPTPHYTDDSQPGAGSLPATPPPPTAPPSYPQGSQRY